MSQPSSPRALAPLGAAPSKGSVRGLRLVGLLLGLVVVWCLLLRQLGGADMYSVLGPYGIAVSLVLLTVRPFALPARLRPTAPAVAIGVGVGVVMTVGTYYAYDLSVALFPGLASHVTALYGATRPTSLVRPLAWTLVVLITEELLWRGALLEEASKLLGSERWGALVSLATYTLVQVGTGSFVVALAAAVCGAFWTVERLATRSLVAPIVSHGIWTVMVILLHPVTGAQALASH